MAEAHTSVPEVLAPLGMAARRRVQRPFARSGDCVALSFNHATSMAGRTITASPSPASRNVPGISASFRMFGSALPKINVRVPDSFPHLIAVTTARGKRTVHHPSRIIPSQRPQFQGKKAAPCAKLRERRTGHSPITKMPETTQHECEIRMRSRLVQTW